MVHGFGQFLQCAFEGKWFPALAAIQGEAIGAAAEWRQTEPWIWAIVIVAYRPAHQTTFDKLPDRPGYRYEIYEAIKSENVTAVTSQIPDKETLEKISKEMKAE